MLDPMEMRAEMMYTPRRPKVVAMGTLDEKASALVEKTADFVESHQRKLLNPKTMIVTDVN